MKNFITQGLLLLLLSIVYDVNGQDVDNVIPMTIGVTYTVSDTLKQKIGTDLLAFMTTADTVTAYHLEQGAFDTTGVHLASFKVLQRKQLSDSLTATLKTLLTQDSTYHFHGLSKQCELLPHIGFSFYKANTLMTLFVDFDCQNLTIQHQGTQKVFDITNGHAQFVALSNLLFNNKFEAYSYSD